MVEQRFPKSCRLLNSKAFERVFNEPDFRVSNQHFLILGRRTDQDTARLGVIVAKKNIARAHERNRIKRLIREAFRTRREAMAAIDLVVLARKGLQFLENHECNTSIDKLMEEINKKTRSH